MSQGINGDRSQVAIMHGMRLPWIPSPQQGVERRMLERIGDEVALATSIVRYAPHSSFAPHSHEFGEEFLVLEGIFADEHGSYPAGTYVRNPPGSSHSPFSADGCTIFVKLRQMSRNNRDQVRLFPQQRVWQSIDEGIERCVLYENQLTTVELIRVKAGWGLRIHQYQHGAELFVVDGAVTLASEPRTALSQWSWLRDSGDSCPVLISQCDSLVWIKRGHLNPLESNG